MSETFSLGGISINGIHSRKDMKACISSRNTGTPQKKVATQTVPYMCGFYDFSAIYGAVAFDSREVTYNFELIGTASEVQSQKSRLLDWFSKAQDVDIYDDDIMGYHFRGSFDSASWSEEDTGEAGSLEVTFLCQPLLIADQVTSATLGEGTHCVYNAGQAVTVTAKGVGTVTIGSIAEAVTEAGVTLVSQLMPGSNGVIVTGGPIILEWRELIA